MKKSLSLLVRERFVPLSHTVPPLIPSSHRKLMLDPSLLDLGYLEDHPKGRRRHHQTKGR